MSIPGAAVKPDDSDWGGEGCLSGESLEGLGEWLEVPFILGVCACGMGGKPPLARPLRIERVSWSRWCARSCWPRETRYNARVSMSDVSNSMRRWTIEWCGGIGGVGGRLVFDDFDVDGSIVIARSDGRGRCVKVPSRRISPYVRSACISGTSSTLSTRPSSFSKDPPRASSPETMLSQ